MKHWRTTTAQKETKGPTANMSAGNKPMKGPPAGREALPASRIKLVLIYKRSAPRAASAARYARARQGRMQLKRCKGGRKKRPMIWCEKRFDNAKSCLEQISLLCLAVLCAFVTGVTF